MTQPTTRPSAHLRSFDALQELLEQLEALPERGRELLNVVRDDLHRAEGELREAEDKYRALVEQIPAIVYIDMADESMVTTYVSPQIEALLGTPVYLDLRVRKEQLDLHHLMGGEGES